ncbi:hypothetical protein D3C81_1012630 [compost metagenome]
MATVRHAFDTGRAHFFEERDHVAVVIDLHLRFQQATLCLKKRQPHVLQFLLGDLLWRRRTEQVGKRTHGSYLQGCLTAG